MSIQTQPTSLMMVIRRPPTLQADDSITRALDILRYAGVDTLPVVDPHDRLRGVVSMADLRPLLTVPDSAPFEAVHLVMRKPDGVLRAGMDVAAMSDAMAGSSETALVVLDEDERYLGMVALADLLSPPPIRPRPPSVGGMATPWGVYLTNGYLQAGAPNLALVVSGLLLGLLLSASDFIVGLGAWGVQHALGIPAYSLWTLPEPGRMTLASTGWVLIHALAIPIFLLLLRAMPLSQYHAAEHQAVHAMERGEPLCVEVLRRMPRVHPRCGTNIMAGGMVFTAVSQALGMLRVTGLDAATASVVGAVAALFTWRSFGAFLQQWFTTRPAADKHLLSGIAAAEQLEEQYLSSPPSRRRLLRRIWCMGVAQVMAGVTISWLAVIWLTQQAIQHLH